MQKALLTILIFAITQQIFAQHLELSLNANYLYFPDRHLENTAQENILLFEQSPTKHPNPTKLYVLRTIEKWTKIEDYQYKSTISPTFSTKIAWKYLKLGLELGTSQINATYQYGRKIDILQLDTLVESSFFVCGTGANGIKVTNTDIQSKMLSIAFPIDIVLPYKSWEFMLGTRRFYNLEYNRIEIDFDDVKAIGTFQSKEWSKVETGFSGHVGVTKWFNNIGFGAQYSQKISNTVFGSDVFDTKTQQMSLNFQYRFI